MNVLTEVPVSELERCTRVQVRAAMHDATVSRYADDMKNGAIFDPVVLFRERGTERYVIADGHHRVDAAKESGKQTIEAEIREGDETAALEFALGANATHGLQRTSKDIENGVRLLLESVALRNKYRTNAERADLLRIAESTYCKYAARWVDEPDDRPEIQQAKAEHKRRAESRTTHKIKNGNGHAGNHAPPRSIGAANEKPAWTAEDQHWYGLLKNYWSKATQAARDKFLAEVG